MTPETDAVAVARAGFYAKWRPGFDLGLEPEFEADLSALLSFAHAAGAEEALARCVTCGLGPFDAHNTYLPLSALKERHEATERVVEAARALFEFIAVKTLSFQAVEHIKPFMALYDKLFSAIIALDAAQKERGADA